MNNRKRFFDFIRNVTASVSTSALFRPVFLLVVLLVALSPIVVYPLGIAGDYPNHLARVYIENRLTNSATLQGHFTVEWGIYPDLAMDLFLQPLLLVMDTYIAGAIFNLVAVAMLPIGVALLSWATTGRVGLPVAASVLLVYGTPVAWGFINFVFSVGLALCLLALWILGSPGWKRTALFSLLMPVLFFCHVLGFLLFGFLMLAYEIGRFNAGDRGSALHFVAGLMLRDGLIAVVPIALFALSLDEHLLNLETDISGFGGIRSRVDALVSPFNFDNKLALAILFPGVYFTLFVSFRRRWITLAPVMRPVFYASVFLVMAVPAAFSGISFLHIRFGAIPAAILLAGASLTPAGQARAAQLCAIFGAFLLLQQISVHQRMAFLDQVQREIREAVSVLPEGARVLIGADAITPVVYRLIHSPSFVVIETDGYVANLFTNTSPVGVADPAMPIHRPQAWPLSRDRLLDGEYRDPPKVAANGMQNDYYHGWPYTFDALLWYRESGSPSINSAHLTEIFENEVFRLYTISPDGE